MKKLAILLAASLLQVSAIHKQTEAAEKADLKALQGVWVLKAVEWMGLKEDQDDMDDVIDVKRKKLAQMAEDRGQKIKPNDGPIHLTIDGNRITAEQWIWPFNSTRERNLSRVKSTFTLDARKKPKIMTRNYGSEKKPDLRYCLYSVKSNSLRLCFRDGGNAKNLPKGFKTDNEEDVYLFIYKRVKNPHAGKRP
jgi:uncharacterized protein (TIGR03067 family)